MFQAPLQVSILSSKNRR